MNEKTESVNAVVVLEQGADWPKWVAEYQRHASHSVVVAHSPGESVAEFSARIRRRLTEITGELRVAIVACAPCVDDTHLAAREATCRMLLEAMAPRRGAELLLAGSTDASDGSKHAIFELAGVLCEGFRGTNRGVRVRFSSGRPESGIMPSVSLYDDERPAYRARFGSVADG
jgi:hypothetical protein